MRNGQSGQRSPSARVLQRAGTCALALCAASGCVNRTGSSTARGAQDTAPDAPTASALLAQGKAAAARGDVLRAEQYLALSLQHGAHRERVLPLILHACLSSGRLRAALNYAEPELRRNPKNSELRLLVATVHLGLGQPAAAHRQLIVLLRSHPHHAEAQYLLGVIHEDHLDDPTGAQTRFRSYLDTTPQGDHAAEARGRLSELSLRQVDTPLHRKPIQ